MLHTSRDNAEVELSQLVRVDAQMLEIRARVSERSRDGTQFVAAQVDSLQIKQLRHQLQVGVGELVVIQIKVFHRRRQQREVEAGELVVVDAEAAQMRESAQLKVMPELSDLVAADDETLELTGHEGKVNAVRVACVVVGHPPFC